MTLPTISDEQRRQMVAQAAYFRAESRGFNGGDPLLDWVEAEAEINARLQQQEHEALLAAVEEQLAAIGKTLRSWRKKLAGTGASARAEWERDIEILARLRDSLEARLTEIRQLGQNASQNAKQQAKRIWDEVSEVINRPRSTRTRRPQQRARTRARASVENPR